MISLDVIEAEERVRVSAGVPTRNAVRAMRSQPGVRDAAGSRIAQEPGVLWGVLSVVIGAG